MCKCVGSGGRRCWRVVPSTVGWCSSLSMGCCTDQLVGRAKCLRNDKYGNIIDGAIT